MTDDLTALSLILYFSVIAGFFPFPSSKQRWFASLVFVLVFTFSMTSHFDRGSANTSTLFTGSDTAELCMDASRALVREVPRSVLEHLVYRNRSAEFAVQIMLNETLQAWHYVRAPTPMERCANMVNFAESPHFMKSKELSELGVALGYKVFDDWRCDALGNVTAALKELPRELSPPEKVSRHIPLPQK